MGFSQGSPHPWRVNWAAGDYRFDAIVSATGYYQSRYVMSDNGKIELEVGGDRSKNNALTILPTMAGAHESFGERESIWFLGAPARPRLWVPNALVVVTPLANRIIESMGQLPQAGSAA